MIAGVMNEPGKVIIVPVIHGESFLGADPEPRFGIDKERGNIFSAEVETGGDVRFVR